MMRNGYGLCAAAGAVWVSACGLPVDYAPDLPPPHVQDRCGALIGALKPEDFKAPQIGGPFCVARDCVGENVSLVLSDGNGEGPVIRVGFDKPDPSICRLTPDPAAFLSPSASLTEWR